MCGIVGYIGYKDAVPVLLEGLKRLEYRGYDSAGLSIIAENGLETYKVRGKVNKLESKLKSYFARSNVGIAHTRWATHGEPSEKNAHPHTDTKNKIAVVHNGIIENFKSLKEELINEGYTFKSDTDSEVIPLLIARFMDRGADFEDAIIDALALLEGTYGIAAISLDNPDKIIGARLGSPLIAGIGENEMILASDASAIVSHTDRVIYLEDGEVITITKNSFTTKRLTREVIQKKIELIDWDIASIEKQGYPHFMLKEIFEQPDTIQNTFRGRLLKEEGTAKLGGIRITGEELAKVKRIIILGCGTSYHAGLIGEYMLEEYTRIPVEVEYASEFRYRNPIINSDDLIFAISQSGETIDTLAAIREAKKKGGVVYGICNVVGSTIARETDAGVYIHAGPEIGVASTKAFTSQVMALILITLMFGRYRNMSIDEGTRIVEEIEKLPQNIKRILDRADYIKEIAAIYADKKNFLYLGRGYHYPVALEGALKLKEISYIHAEGYPAAEMKHGPIALIDEDMPVVVIATKFPVYDKVVSNMQEIKSRKGKIIAIATDGDEEIKGLADHVIYVPKVLEIVSPIISIIPLQLLAYYIAVIRGCDVDKPRNLAKSVTVE